MLHLNSAIIQSISKKSLHFDFESKYATTTRNLVGISKNKKLSKTKGEEVGWTRVFVDLAKAGAGQKVKEPLV